MVGCLYFFYKRNRREVFVIGVVILFLFSIFRFNYFASLNVGEFKNEFFIREDHNGYVILENSNTRFIYYDNNELAEGNKIRIEGEIVDLDLNSEFNRYLKTQKVEYLLKGKVIYNNEYVNLNKRIVNLLLENKDEENSKILRLILFNEKNEDNFEFYNLFSIFSLNFLIVISGFHINLLFKILEKTKISKYVIVLFFLYLLNLSISSLKAFLYYCLKKINRKLNLNFNNMDLLSFILIALLFINPSYCFNMGFIYTFLFSFSIDLINNTIAKNNFKNKLLKKILIFMVSIPLILMSNYEINVMSFVLILLFELPVSILFVFSFIYLFFDKFALLYKAYIFLIKEILVFLNKHAFTLIFGKPSAIIVIILYVSLFLIIYCIENKLKIYKYLGFTLYFLILVIQYSLPIIDCREIVYFLNVGQGDCSVLKIKNSKSVVLIDTGGSEYIDIANDKIIPFLKKKGINRIENVIISHDDFDHNGALEELVSNFKVINIIDSSLIEEIKIGSSKFVNLNISEDRDNDGSIVLYGKYGGINYLFTGDISSEIEEKIIENNKLEVDVLKISHHGSKSSSSENFIKTLKPKVSLIGVGKNNIYKHPSEYVVDILKGVGSSIYRTDINGDITIYSGKKKIVVIREK